MINRDSWEHSYLRFRGDILGLVEDEPPRKHSLAKEVFIDQERKLGGQRRSDTVVVLTVNHANWRLEVVSFITPPAAPYEKSKFWCSGSVVAVLQLEGIHGRAPPGVEPAVQFDSTQENSPGLDTVRINRLIALC